MGLVRQPVADSRKQRFAAALREAMAERKMRISDLASVMDKSPAAIVKWRGGSAWPRESELPRLFSALGLEKGHPLADEMHTARDPSPTVSVRLREPEVFRMAVPTATPSPPSPVENLPDVFQEWLRTQGIVHAIFPDDVTPAGARMYMLPVQRHFLRITVTEIGGLHIRAPMGHLPKQPEPRRRLTEFLLGMNYASQLLAAKAAVDLSDDEITLESVTTGLFVSNLTDLLDALFTFQLGQTIRQSRAFQRGIDTILQDPLVQPGQVVNWVMNDLNEHPEADPREDAEPDIAGASAAYDDVFGDEPF